MLSKVVIFTLFLAFVHGNPVGHYQDEIHGLDSFSHDDHESEDYGHHGHPKYEYNYEVKDDKTGDEKSHQESRDGDQVRGVYTVVDPDGHKRIVEYTVDKHSGFNAVVSREPVPNFTGFHNHVHDHQHHDFDHHQHDFDHHNSYDELSHFH